VPRAKQRTPELRARLLDVAVATLATHGVSGFTTRRIAEGAATSVPAVYELFGDKAGLVREVFFEGFRRLDRAFEAFAEGDDPRDDLERVAAVFRAFVQDNALLFEVMFSRPFADFDPGPDELRAGTRVREFVVRQVQRCIDAGELAGDATDIAHVLVALAQGLAAQEAAGWLGRSRASVDRRWAVAFTALFDGFRPAG
jgi:AcrR family transcriptional regulator